MCGCGCTLSAAIAQATIDQARGKVDADGAHLPSGHGTTGLSRLLERLSKLLHVHSTRHSRSAAA